jgi:hypothetical protein
MHLFASTTAEQLLELGRTGVFKERAATKKAAAERVRAAE